MRGQHREDVTRGGGTYGGQFARDLRASKRTIIDTADLAQLVAARPGTKTALAAGVAGYSEQFVPEMLEKGSALFEDPLEVQQRMVWYLESIGVDVDAIDLSTVPGTGEEQEEKVDYLVSLGLAQETVADIIGRWPQLLRLSLRKNIIPVIKYLECAWIAFRPEQIVELLGKYPQILYHSFELTLQPRVLFLRGVGLTRSQSQDVFLRVPSFFDTRIERSPSTSMAYLGAIGVEMADMWKVAYGCPEILVQKVNEFLKPRFEGIASHLALPEEEARRALLQTPELLLIEDLGGLRDELRTELARRGLVPEVGIIESTSEEAGGEEEALVAQSLPGEEDESAEVSESVSSSERSDDDIREDTGVIAGGLIEGGLTESTSVVEAGLEGEDRVEEGDEAGCSGQKGVQVDVNRIVALFGHRLHDAGVKQTLDKTLGLLGNELEMGPDELRTVLAEYPALLELEPGEIAEKIQALRREGLSTDEIRGMVVADPDWLGVDLEAAFTPKLEFLKVDMERSVNELLEFPNFLCYSLPNRIAVRHQITHEHDKKLSLRRLLGSSPAQFDTAVEKSEWDFEVDELDMAEEAWTIDRAYARQRWEPAKIGAGPVGGLV
ncbi:Mitochondrial transcription termination factor family protein [Klebsormidium nitens]|uniref:Mitochondrial transcription termination factor family protein n=1 Tax=Klebsormidium nitens TaxID=105231 RepID=A0A1Y1IF92_KLENI|nr:Mitochondrial transcription termination factor family protein [Klebsormidium nitens]|eukprot:GAQ88129.1 Mitochondrial transcription termination factor family protein [Klebsormidium nitens]